MASFDITTPITALTMATSTSTDMSSTMASTTSSAMASSTSGSGGSGGGSQQQSGPTNSPLLFFVALGFGVVFTNLWIIVGVKYCFRYNQRNRLRAAGATEAEIDLATLGGAGARQRRRREKKLMSMEEVNERFPLTKYKAWRATREAEGLPAAGGVDANAAAGAAAGGDAATIDTAREIGKNSSETARPETALSSQEQGLAPPPAAVVRSPSPIHEDPITTSNDTEMPSSNEKKVPEKTVVARAETADSLMTLSAPTHAEPQQITTDDADDEDPIRTAAPPELLSNPGDACAICLDNLDGEDDIRGLTCGHAFHAACVDPWLTSRRACCPLCKADYYVPKPRGAAGAADGSELVVGDATTGMSQTGTSSSFLRSATGRSRTTDGAAPVSNDNRSRFVPFGGAVGNLSLPRNFLHPRIENASFIAQPGERRRRREEEAAARQAASGPEQQPQRSRWIPARLSRLGGGGGGAAAAGAPAAAGHGPVEEVSPNELEAGTRRS